MQFDNILDQRQAKTDAFALFGDFAFGRTILTNVGCAAFKRHEDAFLVCEGNAAARICDGDDDIFALLFGIQCNLAAFGGEGDGVADQIHYNLFDAQLIDKDRQIVVRQIGCEFDLVFAGPVFGKPRDRLQNGVEADFFLMEFHISGLDGGQIKNVINQVHQAVARILNTAGIFALFVVQFPEILIIQNFGKAHNRVERCTQLIRYIGQKVCFQFFCGFKGGIFLAQGLFHAG